jgi:hypothetical protein
VAAVIEIVVALIGLIGVLGAAFLANHRRQEKRHAETQDVLSEVRYHTANDHKTNLRDDLDVVMDASTANTAAIGELTYIVKDILVPEVRALGARFDNHIDK